ncbi:alpha/beta hydrolase family protein [Promicromonospora sp. Populi]|uniref:alpha/beta hydrolase family protein n=1 Tax=Promicromonospora sp. Populi TaxID=3239420 RepID=UPI0034E263FB
MTVDDLDRDPSTASGVRAANLAVEVESGSVPLIGVLYLPAGPGPHPVVVLLHGFPGHDANQDLAQGLRRAGYAAVVFHYRGSWGVGGAWSWWNCVEDALAVCRKIFADDDPSLPRLDPRRVAVLGHSLGGFVALQVAATESRVRAVVSVAGFDFGVAQREIRDDPAARGVYHDAWASQLAPLRGTSADALIEELLAAGEAWDLTRLAPAVAGVSVLLVGTGRDTVTPAEIHHWPLVRAFETAGAPRFEHTVLDTDHALADHRLRLAREVTGFLDRHLR